MSEWKVSYGMIIDPNGNPVSAERAVEILNLMTFNNESQQHLLQLADKVCGNALSITGGGSQISGRPCSVMDLPGHICKLKESVKELEKATIEISEKRKNRMTRGK